MDVPENPRSSVKEIVGTLSFMAPEIFKHNGAETAYTEAIDNWAVGVIMYWLLAGDTPFNGDEEYEIEQSIQT